MLKKIINTCLLASLLPLVSFYKVSEPFKPLQLKSARVKAAYQKKWPDLKTLLTSKKIDPTNFDVYLRVFKQEDVLEIWVKNKKETHYTLLKSTPVCAKSGILGPKRKQGDGQVPEGFYEIAAFNPYSSYHLSLKVGYPNKSDAIKADGNPGGDIMIHGFCVTIGCIPIENDPIEELYVLCVEARNRNRPICVDIYPYHFDKVKQQDLAKGFDKETLRFWDSLKKAYLYFEPHHCPPKISVDKHGDYLIEPSAT